MHTHTQTHIGERFYVRGVFFALVAVCFIVAFSVLRRLFAKIVSHTHAWRWSVWRILFCANDANAAADHNADDVDDDDVGRTSFHCSKGLPRGGQRKKGKGCFNSSPVRFRGKFRFASEFVMFCAGFWLFFFLLTPPPSFGSLIFIYDPRSPCGILTRLRIVRSFRARLFVV